MAVGLAVYVLLLVFDDRWSAAGWLFGASLALQPLVLLMLPVLLVAAGVKRWPGFLVRAAVPVVAVLALPLVTSFDLTTKALIQQPNYPLANHETPWTALAPRVHENMFAVSAGPGRAVSLILACAVGWWASRVRDRPELLVWAAALTLALRCFTESVMDPYYLWPALAVAMVASARARPWRFGATLIAAVFITVSSQWHLGWLAWWIINLLGLTALLLSSIPFQPVLAAERVPQRVRTGARAGYDTARGRGAANRKQQRRARRR
jgi:hypothetical protein